MRGNSNYIRVMEKGPLARYVKLRVAQALGMPGTFSRHRLQRKPPISDPGIHHDMCVTHVPWCMLGSLTRSGEENVLGIPGACATRNFAYLVRGPWGKERLETETRIAVGALNYMCKCRWITNVPRDVAILLYGIRTRKQMLQNSKWYLGNGWLQSGLASSGFHNAA